MALLSTAMTFYTPIFSKIVDSSLWREPDHVLKVFLTLLAKQDPDHVVRGNAYNIGEWAKKTEQEAIDALKVLSSPDKLRLEKQPYDGRRIEKVNDGWLILNGEHYQQMMIQLNRKRANAARQKRFREKNKGGTLAERNFVKADGDGNATEADRICAQ